MHEIEHSLAWKLDTSSPATTLCIFNALCLVSVLDLPMKCTSTLWRTQL